MDERITGIHLQQPQLMLQLGHLYETAYSRLNRDYSAELEEAIGSVEEFLAVNGGT